MINEDSYVVTYVITLFIVLGAMILWGMVKFIKRRLEKRTGQEQNYPATPVAPVMVAPGQAASLGHPLSSYEEKGRNNSRVFKLYDGKVTVRFLKGIKAKNELAFKYKDLAPSITTTSVRDKDYPRLFLAAFILSLVAALLAAIKMFTIESGYRRIAIWVGLGAVTTCFVGAWSLMAKTFEYTVFRDRGGNHVLDIGFKSGTREDYDRFILQLLSKIKECTPIPTPSQPTSRSTE